ncbi:MAG: arsenosugar biosynthesis radical SAM (seleno)protein ArsS [Vicinamibacterales bacterium]
MVPALLDTAPSFESALQSAGVPTLARGVVDTLQINVGRVCNQACHHCHVEAGPKRTEALGAEVADRLIELLDANPGLRTVDLTGGAPELNAHFRPLVLAARARGLRVIDRCNLTILREPGQEDLAGFLAAQGVDIVASLPCYTLDNVDRQRGLGVFDASIEALRQLNALGYGQPESPLRLDLVFNPLGASLPPAQAELEAQYRDALGDRFGIVFHHLLTITNMPIRRFAGMLEREGRMDAYMSLLVQHFNPATVAGLMCRSLVSVSWDGGLYDCDFNQMLDLPMAATPQGRPTIWDVSDLGGLRGARVATGGHCFGCTAGAGSGCSGAVV